MTDNAAPAGDTQQMWAAWINQTQQNTAGLTANVAQLTTTQNAMS